MTTRNGFRRLKADTTDFFIFLFVAVAFLFGFGTASHAVTVALKWGASEGSTGYKVYYQADSATFPFSGTGATEGNAPLDVSNQTSATISGLDPGHSYHFAVTAYNAAGESSYSNVVSVPEMTSPVASISYPANNAAVSGTVAVTANASDNVGVSSVGFYVNGVLQGTDTSTPYTCSWNTSSLAAGTYTLSARAHDAAGNSGESSALTVRVVKDATTPVVALTSPSGGTKVSGTVSIAVSASDNVGVSRVEFYANGALLSASNVAPYSYLWNTASLSNGSYALSARAYDSAGNVGQSAPITVTVSNQVADTIAPTLSSFTMPTTATSLTVAITTLSATDAAGVTGYLVTESSTKPSAAASGWSTGAPAFFSFSAAGTKTAYAWAKDAAGNVSGSLSRTVTITQSDTTAPTVAIKSPSNNAIIKGTTTISATASDNVRVGKVEFYVNGVLKLTDGSAPYAYKWNTSTTANGSCTVMTRAYDLAGNMGQSKTVTVTVRNRR